MNKLKFLLIIFSIFSVSNLFSQEEDVSLGINIGGSISFPVSTVNNIYYTGLDIGAKLKDPNLTDEQKNQIIKDLSDIINIANTGLRYGTYVQFGANFNNFVLVGGELVFNFNLIQPVNNNGSKHFSNAFVMGVYTRFYTKLDLFILSLAMFTGPQVNIVFTDSDSILKDSGWFYWDLGGRITIGWLMVEGFYSWNIKNNKFSDFHVGIGLEFSIL